MSPNLYVGSKGPSHSQNPLPFPRPENTLLPQPETARLHLLRTDLVITTVPATERIAHPAARLSGVFGFLKALKR